jgi:hypothetical protein
LHCGDEFAAAAMHDDIGVEAFELGNTVLDIVHRRRAEMKSAQNGTQFAGPGNRHRGFDRIDQPDMTAGRNDDEPAALHEIAGRMLVRVLVGDETP